MLFQGRNIQFVRFKETADLIHTATETPKCFIKFEWHFKFGGAKSNFRKVENTFTRFILLPI